MQMKSLQIGEYIARIPIVQGGMSIRNSMAPLAAAVAEAGGIGVIGASAIPLDELLEEIKKCREMTKGIIAVNVMYAINDFVEIVKGVVDAGVDMIFTGAGFSKDIYKFVDGTKTAVVSIVSSVKAALLAERLGANAIVVEGAEAGGHLGTDKSLDEIFPEIRERIKSIPVIAAGGIIDGHDIAKYLRMGADGVQMASRFVCSEECSAPDEYKKAYVECSKDDIILVESPVGLPGRAIRNKLADEINSGKVEFNGCKEKCLKVCSYKYCINDKLNNAMTGDINDGLIFSGSNSWKITKIQPVKEIFEELISEVESEKE